MVNEKISENVECGGRKQSNHFHVKYFVIATMVIKSILI